MLTILNEIINTVKQYLEDIEGSKVVIDHNNLHDINNLEMIEEEEEESRRESMVNYNDPPSPILIMNFDRSDYRSRSRKTSEHYTKKQIENSE